MSKTMTSGSIWDVPKLPTVRYVDVPADVWLEVETLLRGYRGKCKDAVSLNKREWVEPGWLDAKTGLTADELGAPVQQAVMTLMLLRREQQP